MSKNFYCDTNTIKRWEMTDEGYLRVWLTFGVPDQNLEYITDSGKRIEYIDKESLIDSKSLATLIGKPLPLNHPPIPIVSSNWGEYAKGFTMQHVVDTEDGIPVISAVIYDPETIDKIVKGQITKTSSAYWAEKVEQTDGRLRQVNRQYNHIALLTNEFEPRAGSKSEIVLDSIASVKTSKEEPEMTTKKTQSDNTEGTVTEPVTESKDSSVLDAITELSTQIKSLIGFTKGATTDAKEPEKPTEDQQKDSVSIRTELWAKWKETIEKNNKTVDYSLDSSGIKRLVLGCYYEDSVVKELSDEAILDGFWKAFEMSQNKGKTESEKSSQSDSGDGEPDYEKQFIERTTKIKK